MILNKITDVIVQELTIDEMKEVVNVDMNVQLDVYDENKNKTLN